MGDLVFVAVRSWAGMNDEGGRAWVTKVNDDNTVDIRYVMRGKRQGVSLRDISNVIDTGKRPKRRSSSLQDTQPAPARKKAKRRPQRASPPAFVYNGDPPTYRCNDRVEARRPELNEADNRNIRFEYYYSLATVVKFLPRMSRRVHWYILRFDSDNEELAVPLSRDNFLHIRPITTPPRHDVYVPRKRIAQLKALTGLPELTAKALLVACNNDVAQASASFFDKQGSASNDVRTSSKTTKHIPRKRKQANAKSALVSKSKTPVQPSTSTCNVDTQADLGTRRNTSHKLGRVARKATRAPIAPSQPPMPLAQAFLSVRIEAMEGRNVNMHLGDQLWTLCVRLEGAHHFIEHGLRSLQAQGK